MFLDTRDIGIVPHLCTDGIWETYIESVFRRTVKPGWRVVDVGANFGYYSVLLGSLIGRQGSGLVIDAIPEIYSLLSSTIEVNGYRENIKVMNYAAFDRRTTLAFNVRPSRKLNSHFVAISPKTKDNFTIQVPAMTIDAMIAEQWRDGIVNFIKIDIEGAEARAWKGMQETLRKNKDSIVIIIEVNTKRLKSMNEDSKSESFYFCFLFKTV
jgi:FkbM family methyltransferase